MYDGDETGPKVSDADFEAPIDRRYFEDYRVGAVHRYGAVTVDQSRGDRVRHQVRPAKRCTSIRKPPPAGLSGGLIASGWHTTAMMMRLFADHYLSKVASLASPGVDELRWTRPVRPGDTLTIRVTVLEANVSRSKPDRGVVRTLIEVLNQNGDQVMSCKAINLLRRRGSA